MDENQENGAANGSDVPEIELIIKEEFTCTDQSDNHEKEKHNDHQEVQNTHNQEKEIELKNIYITYTIDTTPQNIVVKQLDYNNGCNVETNDNNEYMRLNFVANCNEYEVKGKSEQLSIIPKEYSFVKQSGICDDNNTNSENMKLTDERDERLFEDLENNSDVDKKVETRSSQSMDFCDCRTGDKLKRDSKALQIAISAVLNDGITLGQAAKKYKVSKSTLWSRVSKHPTHRRRKFDDELAEVIYKKLSAGDSLSEISRSLNIAKSTVHQHKMRLTKFGRLPPVLLLKKDREGGAGADIKNRLIQAHRGCRVNGMSVRFAAEFYSVPITTLWRFIKQRQTAPKNAELTEKEATVQKQFVELNNIERIIDPTEIKIEEEEEFISSKDSTNTEIDPQHYKLFEDTYLKHLFD